MIDGDHRRGTHRRTRIRFGRRVTASDDSGATLLMALIFVTVVSLVVAAILSLVDSSFRATGATRAQASQAAAADGAAQVALNALRNSTYQGAAGANCFGPGATAGTDTLDLKSFYKTTNGAQYSATVKCALDTVDSQLGTGVLISEQNKPKNSILTLGTSGAEDGIYLHTYISSDVIEVHGDTFSNSNIDVDKIKSDSTVKARQSCSGTIIAAVKSCNIGNVADASGVDPNYSPNNVAGSTAKPVPTCVYSAHRVYEFQPGIYTNLDALNNLTNLLCNGTYYFRPGTYYFDYDGEWTVNGNLVGGTTQYGTGALPNNWTPNIPGACKSPIPPDPMPVGWTPPGRQGGSVRVRPGEPDHLGRSQDGTLRQLLHRQPADRHLRPEERPEGGQYHHPQAGRLHHQRAGGLRFALPDPQLHPVHPAQPRAVHPGHHVRAVRPR